MDVDLELNHLSLSMLLFLLPHARLLVSLPLHWKRLAAFSAARGFLHLLYSLLLILSANSSHSSMSTEMELFWGTEGVKQWTEVIWLKGGRGAFILYPTCTAVARTDSQHGPCKESALFFRDLGIFLTLSRWKEKHRRKPKQKAWHHI